VRLRIPAAVALAVTALVTLPAEAFAQGRAVVRVRPRTTVVVGVGAYAYRPFYYGYYSPFWYDSWYYSPYAQIYPPYYGRRYDISSSLRLQVMPRQTEVFIDGYYAGIVDDFDGTFQRLHVEPGEHDVELYLAGHRSFTQKLYLQPNGSTRIRHEMVPLPPGEVPPARPTGGPLEERPDSEDYPARRAPGPGRDRDPQRPARGAPSDFGSLALRVQPPDAEILIDGEQWQGASDDRLVVELGAGIHHVEIRKDGYRTYITEVTVRPGETASLNVAMTKQ
jgi:hypothetical protein